MSPPPGTSLDKSKTVSYGVPGNTLSIQSLKLVPTNGISLAQVLQQLAGKSTSQSKVMLVAGDITQLPAPDNGVCESDITHVSDSESVVSIACSHPSEGVVDSIRLSMSEGASSPACSVTWSTVNTMCSGVSAGAANTMGSGASNGGVNSTCLSAVKGVVGTVHTGATEGRVRSPSPGARSVAETRSAHKSHASLSGVKRKSVAGAPKSAAPRRGPKSRSSKNETARSTAQHLKSLKDFVKKKEKEVELITQQLRSLEKEKARTIALSVAGEKCPSAHIDGESKNVSKASQPRAAGVAKKIRFDHSTSSEITLPKHGKSPKASIPFIPDVKSTGFLELLGLEVVVDILVQDNVDFLELTPDK